jgi:hypothetical protein
VSEIGHNSGAVDPELAAEAMKRALEPWASRKDEFVTKAEAAAVSDMDSAQVAVDFVRMVGALRDKAKELMAEVRAPYSQAADAAGSVAMRFIEELDAAEDAVRGKLRAYRDAARKAAEELEAQQRAEEERLRKEAAARLGEVAPPPPPPELTPQPRRRRKAAPIRTDLGGMLSEQERWRIRVDDVSQIPENVLNSDRVKEAIAKVAYDLVKNGIAVPGTSKEFYTTETIR